MWASAEMEERDYNTIPMEKYGGGGGGVCVTMLLSKKAVNKI